MGHFRQIIIGSGISALTFANTSQGVDVLRPRSGERPKWDSKTGTLEVRKDSSVVMEPDYLDEQGAVASEKPYMIGPTDQWHKFTFPKGGKTGQPGNLHQFPGQAPDAQEDQFSPIGTLAGKLDQMKAKIEGGLYAIGDALVESVTRTSAAHLQVKLRGGEEPHTAEQVIIACGPGPERELDASVFENRKVLDGWSRYPRLLSGVDFLFEKESVENTGRHLVLVVQGGSATAAWVSEKAFGRGNRVIWHTRPGGTEFKEADPAGRNTETIRKFRDITGQFHQASLDFPQTKDSVRFLGELEKVTFSSWHDARTSIVVEFKGGRGTRFAHRYIYCLGADPTAQGGPGAILDASIRRQMEPYWDIDQIFPVNSAEAMGRSVLALCTPERDVWVIGSALHQALGMSKTAEKLKDVPKAYGNLRATLPSSAGGPPEGLGGAVASIEALTNYVPESVYRGQEINFNTANQTQIAIYLAAHKIWGNLKATVRNRIVQRIMEERMKKENQFGLKDVTSIIKSVMGSKEGLTVLRQEKPSGKVETNLIKENDIWESE